MTELQFANNPRLEQVLLQGVRDVQLRQGDIHDFIEKYVGGLALGYVWTFDKESYIADPCTLYAERVNLWERILRIGKRVNDGKKIFTAELKDTPDPGSHYYFYFSGYTEEGFANIIQERVERYLSTIEQVAEPDTDAPEAPVEEPQAVEG